MITQKRVYGEKYVLSEKDDQGKYTDMPIRAGQYIQPLFMITEITKTIKNAKIKAKETG